MIDCGDGLVPMADDGGSGLGDLRGAEANVCGVRPGPGVVFLRLTRNFPSEGRRRDMFVEFTPGEAVSLIRHLQDCVRIALANDDAAASSRAVLEAP